MNQAYLEIIKILDSNTDCVERDNKDYVSEKSIQDHKVHQILNILTQYGYVDKNHIVFPEFTS